LNASRDDEENLPRPVNDRSFGFHAQQSIEKLLKALIAGHQQKYKYTHDIADLLLEITNLGETPSIDPRLAKSLTDYAGVWRYQAPVPISADQKAAIHQAITALRVYVLGRLSILRPDIDWTEFK
jgi:HEPN domain-containing protein